MFTLQQMEENRNRNTVPVWPRDIGKNPRRMCFVSGEARWYLWFQEENKQAISTLRRDLLLLHQNGDLELIKKMEAVSPGTYITALYEGKMIRGRVCSNQKRSEAGRSSKYISVIDIDEGKTLELPTSQVRALPVDAMSLPCQSIRCDINLECEEQFDWPKEINKMLFKALEGVYVFVEMVEIRPGSVPTISAKVIVCNPATGESISIQKWLMEKFSAHLDLCSFEKYKPFPVGMSAKALEQGKSLLHEHVFGMNALSMPSKMQPSLHLPPHVPPHAPPHASPHIPPCMAMPPLPMAFPSFSQNFAPQMFHGVPLVCQGGPPPNTFVVPHTPAGKPIGSSGLHPFQMGPPNPIPNHNISSQFPVPGSRVQTSMVSIQFSQSAVPSDVSSGNQPKTDKNRQFSERKTLHMVQMSSSNSSLSGSECHTSSVLNSDQTHSTVAIDLDQSVSSSLLESSSSSLNPDVAPYVPKNNYSNTTRIQDKLTASSSELSVNAAPFTPACNSSKHGTAFFEPRVFPSSEEKKSEPASATDVSKPAPMTHKSGELFPLPSRSIAESSSQAGPSSNFLKGSDVELEHIARDWKVGQVLSAFMARVWNPSCFEVNVVDEYSALLSRIQTEMEIFYKSNRIAIHSKVQAQELCGDFCACYDAEEDMWFRGEVEQWFKDDSITPVKVWAVDLGGFVRVDISCVQPLMTELACTTPVLITLCSMKNVLPISDCDVWPEAHLAKVKELLPDDKQLYLRIDGPKSKEEVWPVSVFTSHDCSTISINETLVSEGFAYYAECTPEMMNSLGSKDAEIFEDSEDPMEEAYKTGGNNYEIDDEDACFAVSGRKPTEEIGICWYYNKQGHCYKKFCDLKHVRLDPAGHSIEKRELHVNAFEEIGDDILAPGKQITLTVTRILTVNHFFARMHIKRGTPGLKSRETLKSMINNLNSPAMKRSLKALNEYPADGEIVLYKDKMGTFYRGRVVGSDVLDDNIYEVLNVDTGYISKVSMNNLRQVDPAFLHHPFQAIECWLADVSPTQTDRDWTKTCNELFAEIVRGQKVYATIVRSAPRGIEVNLMDNCGRDIAISLKEQGILKSCPGRHLPTSSSYLIPG